MSWAESTPGSLLHYVLGKQCVLQEMQSCLGWQGVDCSLPTVFMPLKREDWGFHWVPWKNREGVCNE